MAKKSKLSPGPRSVLRQLINLTKIIISRSPREDEREEAKACRDLLEERIHAPR